MSSSSETHLSEEPGMRQGFARSVWQALSGSRIPTSEEKRGNAPSFGGEDAGTTNREFAPVGPTGFLEKPDVKPDEPLTDIVRVGEVRLRESPLTFYSDRQLGKELDSNAGRKAGIDFTDRSSRPFSSSPHQHSVGFVSERGPEFPDPTRSGTRGFVEPDFCQPIPRQYASSDGPSPRLGHNDEGNITQRDGKRPKERSRDKAYKQRFSMGSSGGVGGFSHPAFFVSGSIGPDQGVSVGQSTPVRRDETPRQSWEYGYVKPASVVRGHMRESAASSAQFEILLSYGGSTVNRRVWDEMPIAQLMAEAGSIFGLDSTELILVLSSSPPMTLQRGGSIMGPPRVCPGSNVIVLQVHAPRSAPGISYVPPTGAVSFGHGAQTPYHPDHQVMSTKLLAIFKLPKFDGVARSWKA